MLNKKYANSFYLKVIFILFPVLTGCTSTSNINNSIEDTWLCQHIFGKKTFIHFDQNVVYIGHNKNSVENKKHRFAAGSFEISNEHQETVIKITDLRGQRLDYILNQPSKNQLTFSFVDDKTISGNCQRL